VFAQQKTVVLGDSLSATYNNTPYGDPSGGIRALSWTEILDGRTDGGFSGLRPSAFDLGSNREGVLSNLLEALFGESVTGRERNWSIPGATAQDFEEIITATFLENPSAPLLRSEVEGDLADADHVIIFLGANDVSNNYGLLCNNAPSSSVVQNFIDALMSDLAVVLDYVKEHSPADARIVFADVIEMSITPDKADCANARAAIGDVRDRVATLAASEGVAHAMMYAAALEIGYDPVHYVGSVPIMTADPGSVNRVDYLFTNDGFHPATAGQILIAREIIAALNREYDAGIARISDGEAIALLGLGAPGYNSWITGFSPADTGFVADPDLDDRTNGEEWALADGSPVASQLDQPLGIKEALDETTGQDLLIITWEPRTGIEAVAEVHPVVSTNLSTWNPISEDAVINNQDGTFTAVLELGSQEQYLRLEITRR
jgi:lysophospholipase L1-like esterase